MDQNNTSGPGLAPRITPLPVSGMQDEWLQILSRIPGGGLKGAFSPVNVLGTLMHNPRTFGPFLDYWITSKTEMGFSVREQEMVILRMGVHYHCNYIWKHHVPVAREFGVSDREIEAVRSPEIPDFLSSREQALLALTDELVSQRTIRDEAWMKYATAFREQEMVDLISLVSQYVFFGLINNALRVQVEEPLGSIPGLF